MTARPLHARLIHKLTTAARMRPDAMLAIEQYLDALIDWTRKNRRNARDRARRARQRKAARHEGR